MRENLNKFPLSERVSILTVNTLLLNAAGYTILVYVYLYNLACGVNAALGGCQTRVCVFSPSLRDGVLRVRSGAEASSTC